ESNRSNRTKGVAVRSRLAAPIGLLSLASALLVAAPAAADAPTDLFISEYVEGSSFNKAIEIYNGTGADVALAGYALSQFSNGSSTASVTLNLTGTLADGDVYVIAHSS